MAPQQQRLVGDIGEASVSPEERDRAPPPALQGPLTKGVEQQPQAQHGQRVPPANEKGGWHQQQQGLRWSHGFKTSPAAHPQSPGHHLPPAVEEAPTRLTAATSPPGLIRRA